MLTAIEIAQLEKTATKKGVITSDEAKFLTQSSLKKSIYDLFTPQEDKRLKTILVKIAMSENLELLSQDLSNELTQKLKKYYQGQKIHSEEYYMKQEAMTGLRAFSVQENFNVSFSLHSEDSTAFFKVTERGEKINISFNKNHHIYPILQNLKKKDNESYQLFLDLFHSWGLYEMDFHSRKEAEYLREHRELWGRKLRDLLRSRDAKN